MKLRPPRTLASRLSIIFLSSLLLAHGLSFGLQTYERYSSAKALMLSNFELDVATSVAMLERLPASERPSWLKRVDRPTYRYRLDEGLPGTSMNIDTAPLSVRSIQASLGQDYSITFRNIPDALPRYQAHLTLKDGQPLTIDAQPAVMPISPWLPILLVAQLLALILCTWLAVRTTVRPLTRFARAVDDIDLTRQSIRLDEKGPAEVVYAAMAFNRMQDRIAAYVKERVRLLAAISHDLQTPITRMKLRVELMEDFASREKLWADLNEMQHLVKEGIAYARSTEPSTEQPKQVQLNSLLESLVFDYTDMGKDVQLLTFDNVLLRTQPQVLRRLLTNLIDNALKFAGAALVLVEPLTNGNFLLKVLDRGPGIPEQERTEVLEPFYRLESSRNRDTGGAGLGLAISAHLANTLGSELQLVNRQGGGLCVQFELTARD